MATQRAVLRRLLVWALIGVLPYAVLMTSAFVNMLAEGIIDIPEILRAAIWIAFYLLVPAVFVAGILAVIDIGLLVALRRTNINRWIRAAIPAVVVGVTAMGLFSAYVLMTMFNLYGTGHYYAWAAVSAAVVAAAVYASHVHHYRSVDTQ